MQVIARDNDIYDALVVGSGATGGWAAKQLTEAGMKVAVLEAGDDGLFAHRQMEHHIGDRPSWARRR